MNVDKNLVRAEIIEMISSVTRIKKDELSESASLRDDLYIDSLQASQIVALIEEKYKIKIDEIEIFNIEYLSDIIDLIIEYLNQ